MRLAFPTVDALELVELTRTRLKTHEGAYAELSRQTPGLSYSWLTKFAHGQADNPTIANLQLLITALDAFEGVPAQQPAANGAGQ